MRLAEHDPIQASEVARSIPNDDLLEPRTQALVAVAGRLGVEELCWFAAGSLGERETAEVCW